MLTLNGFGMRLYGKKDKNADGWYTATKFFCVFWFPIFPIDCYRVREICSSGNFVVGHGAYEMYPTAPDTTQAALVYAAFHVPAAVVFVLINIFGR